MVTMSRWVIKKCLSVWINLREMKILLKEQKKNGHVSSINTSVNDDKNEK